MSYNNPRIKLDMNNRQLLLAMGGGNTGALTVLARLLKYGALIDPQAAFGGLGVIMSLDTDDIYEHRIWMLYKDVCKEDLVAFVGMTLAVQLGKLDIKTLNHAIDNRGEGLDVDAVLKAVKDELEEFGKCDPAELN